MRRRRRPASEPILVVGSVAFDDVRTPAGEVRSAIGGAAIYFAVAATILHRPVRLVGVAGRDFPEEVISMLERRGVETDGLARADGETFRWAGYYEGTMDEAVTVSTRLNVFADFRPALPAAWRSTPYVFLANIDPGLQANVLDQVTGAAPKRLAPRAPGRPRVVAMDTMNFWIASRRDDLVSVMRRVDLVVMNDGEARQLTGEANLVRAARAILDLGPRAVALKKGSHGALVAARLPGDRRVRLAAIPAYPVEKVVDPTGAGDSFGAGLMASLAAEGAGVDDWRALRRAAARGAVVASFDVEGFSIERLRRATPAAVDRRLATLREIAAF